MRRLSVGLGAIMLLSTLLLSVGPALAESQGQTVQMAQNASFGTILTGPNGMTLYVFTKDAPGVSNCYGQCAVNWPPLLIRAGESLSAPPGVGGSLGTTTRNDGSVQVTLNGAPLYYWIKDKAVGETTGHTVGGVWFVSQPGLMLDAAGSWAQSQLSAAVELGLVQGYPDQTIRGELALNRAEAAALVTRALGVTR